MTLQEIIVKVLKLEESVEEIKKTLKEKIEHLEKEIEVKKSKKNKE